MMNRDSKIITIRDSEIGEIGTLISVEEKFQNQTLRPILKLQNQILLQICSNHIQKYIKNYHQNSISSKLMLIENTIQKDHKFKNLLIGTIIGHFTIEEYLFYSENPTSLNKRLINMLVERIKSQIQIFEN